VRDGRSGGSAEFSRRAVASEGGGQTQTVSARIQAG